MSVVLMPEVSHLFVLLLAQVKSCTCRSHFKSVNVLVLPIVWFTLCIPPLYTYLGITFIMSQQNRREEGGWQSA